MTRSGTVREALIADALGEVARLIVQIEALAPALDQSRQALAHAHDGLAAELTAFESRMAALTENAKVQVMRHIARRTEETAREAAQAQVRAMEASARVLFREEIGPALQQAALPLRRLADLADRGSRPWQPWLTHMATAGVASGLTWALAAWLWAR